MGDGGCGDNGGTAGHGGTTVTRRHLLHIKMLDIEPCDITEDSLGTHGRPTPHSMPAHRHWL